MTPGVRLWVGLSVALALLATAVTLTGMPSPSAIDWQPGRFAGEPWRAFSAVALHYSPLHLLANLTGALLVAALGAAARVPTHCALAWLAAWPLTQIGLLLQPELTHFGGLSGVLHAGVAIAAVHLALRARGGRRTIGAGLLAGLVIKVLSETPWGAPLRHPTGWDIAVAPLAHASGVVVGCAAALFAEALADRKSMRDR